MQFSDTEDAKTEALGLGSLGWILWDHVSRFLTGKETGKRKLEYFGIVVLKFDSLHDMK